MIATAETAAAIPTEPGWYYDVPMWAYLAIPAMSASGIVALNRSPKHYRWQADNPKPETPSMFEGSALHAALLEPELFEEEYVIAEACQAELKSGDRKGQSCEKPGKVVRGGLSYCGTHDPDKTAAAEGKIISPDMAMRIEGMKGAVLEHPDARQFFVGKGRSEVVGLWRDEATGRLCKIRLDRDIERAALHADVKTCPNASKGAFPRHAAKLGYPLKCAWYRRGMAELGRPAIGSLLIAVEKTAPHGCQLFLLSETSIRKLEGRIDQLLQVEQECERTGVWPSYERGMRHWELSPWELEDAAGEDGDDDNDDAWEGFE